MKKINISSFEDYLITIDKLCKENNKYNLYRGQSENKPLLPSICRDAPNVDTTKKEIEMLDELKRRSSLLINKEHDKWNLLVVAQHFGMKTRLLDWSSNPLIALWFACKSEFHLAQDSYVYVFQAGESAIIDPTVLTSPFETRKTKILRPTLNNERIIAQSGWFTVHKYVGKKGKFITLESNVEYKQGVTQLLIPSSTKLEILKKLSRYGVSNRTVFPDLEGLCKHLNWRYSDDA